MATLEKIRNQAGLLVVVVGLALFAFIIGDFLNSGSSYFRQSHDQVVEVDGTAINYPEYQNRIEEMSKIYKRQTNTGTLSDEQNTQIRQSVYSSIVQEIVLKDVLDRLGVAVTSEELFDMVQGENISPMAQQFPMFIDQQTGAFSRARALSMLKTIENIETVPAEYRGEVEQAREYWLFWERNMKLQRLQDKYTTLLTKAIVANPLEAKDAYEAKVENSDIVYAMQSYSTVPDTTIQVSDSEVKNIYNQRKEQFKQKESRVIDYIVADIRPSQDDYEKVRLDADKIKDELAHAEKAEDIVNGNSEVPYLDAFVSEKGLDVEMKSFVERANIGDIEGPFYKDDSFRLLKLVDKTVAPDSVKVSHILLASQDGDDKTIVTLADSLMTVLKSGGDFEELASKYSVDQTGETGGEIGWLTESGALRYGEEFKDAVFSAAANQPMVLKASYGVHILKITEKTPNVPKYKLAYVHLSVTPSTTTYGNIYNELNQFISKNTTVEKINASAREAGLILVPDAKITTDDRILSTIPDSRPVIRWAFESEKKDQISQIFECKDQFVVAVRKDVLPEGYQSLQSVAPILKSEIRTKKKGEEIAKELKAKNLHSMTDYAQAMKSTIDTVRFINLSTPRISGVGLEPVLNAEVSFTPLNQLSEPVIGNNGVYIFTVFNRTKETGSYDEQAEILTLESAKSYRVGYLSVQSLVDHAKIVDNRIRFD